MFTFKLRFTLKLLVYWRELY